MFLRNILKVRSALRLTSYPTEALNVSRSSFFRLPEYPNRSPYALLAVCHDPWLLERKPLKNISSECEWSAKLGNRSHPTPCPNCNQFSVTADFCPKTACGDAAGVHARQRSDLFARQLAAY